MAKFTKADEIEVPQSVGPFLNIWPRGSNLRVYEPEQGRDLLSYPLMLSIDSHF